MRQVYKLALEFRDKPEIEKITRSIQEWTQEEQVMQLPEGFESGIIEETPLRKVETIRFQDKGLDHLGIKLEQQDPSNRDSLWITKLGAIRSNEKTSLTLLVENDSTKIHVPLQKGLREASSLAPWLVSTSEEAYFKNDLVGVFPSEVTNDTLPNLIKLIKDENRIVPIVFASPFSYNLGPRVDVDVLARDLAGVAIVKYSKDSRVTWGISQNLGKEKGCWSGAVRVYKEFKEGQGRSPFWRLPEVEREGFHYIILEEICARTTRISSESDFERIREKRDRINLIKLLEERTSKAQLTQAYERTLKNAREERDTAVKEKAQVWAEYEAVTNDFEKLKKDYESQTQELEETKKQTAALNDRCEQQRVAFLSAQKAEARRPAAQEIVQPKTFDSIIDVIQEVQSEMKPHIVITNKAERGARGQSKAYNNPDSVYKAFEWMRDFFLPNLRGVIRRDLEMTALTHCDMQYSARQKLKTMKAYWEDYHAMYEGIEFELPKHLKKGNSPDGTNSIRIAFAFDEREGGRAIVGYIGPHQQNQQS